MIDMPSHSVERKPYTAHVEDSNVPNGNPPKNTTDSLDRSDGNERQNSNKAVPSYDDSRPKESEDDRNLKEEVMHFQRSASDDACMNHGSSQRDEYPSDGLPPTNLAKSNSGNLRSHSSQQLKKSGHSHTKLKGHSRSSSHNKLQINNHKPSIPNPAMSNRPNLNRSKSTDGLIKSSHRNTALKRNNRSLTKLTALQPLTRTTSNPSSKNALRPLTKTMSNQSIKSNKSNTSLKNLALSHNVQLSGLKTSGRKGKAILRLNDDIKDEEFEEDLSEDSEDEARAIKQKAASANFTQQQLNQLQNLKQSKDFPNGIDKSNIASGHIHSEPNLSDTNQNYQHQEQDQRGSVSYFRDMANHTQSDTAVITASQIKGAGEEIQANNKSQNPSGSQNTNAAPTNESKSNSQIPLSAQSSSDDLVSSNLYGGSLLLSQSTGLTKKIDPKASAPGQVYTGTFNNGSIPVPRQAPREPLGSGNSESVSGISFKANPINNSNNNIAEPIITSRNAAPANSYQPNQTIFNNLQRTNSQYVSSKKTQFNNGTNNFADFLKNNNNNNTNIDSNSNHFHSGSGSDSSHNTRTQQRLWLQRENSLMDVPSQDHFRQSTLSNVSLNKLMISQYNSSTNVRDYPTPGSAGLNGPSSHIGTPATPTTASVEPNASMNNISGMFLMAQNRYQNPIQSRTEFERLNREYLNVRRHLNPVAETLNRVDEILSNTKGIDPPKRNQKKSAAASLSSISLHGGSTNNNSFKEFSPYYQERKHEVSKTIDNLWNDALLESSASSNSLRLANQQRGQQRYENQQQTHQPQHQRESQQLQNQAMESRNPGQTSVTHANARTQQPTTRKLAAQAAAQQKQQQQQQQLRGME